MSNDRVKEGQRQYGKMLRVAAERERDAYARMFDTPRESSAYGVMQFLPVPDPTTVDLLPWTVYDGTQQDA